MSYCRFTEADVYVYMDVAGALRCCGCSLQGDAPDPRSRLARYDGEFFRSTQAMIDHLAAHAARGDRVPARLPDRLREDDAENFPPDGGSPGQNGTPLVAG
jgi:hypothetical protein